MDETEIWKAVPSLNSLYEASNFGRIRSVRRRVPCAPSGTRTTGGKVLADYPTHRGHRAVHASVRGHSSGQKVHRLVLEAFAGPCPAGMECCHDDGNPANNHLSNLKWGTKLDNADDKHRHGTMYRGEPHHYSKLTEAQVREIRRLYDAKVRLCTIAVQFGIDRQHVFNVGKRKSWRHVA